MASRRKNVELILNLPVAFEGITIGDKTCRIGLAVDRQELTLSNADKQLCDRRLTGTIKAYPHDQQEDQGSLPGMDQKTEVDGAFDVKGFRVSKQKLFFGLTFAVESVDVGALAHFAKKAGRLMVEQVGEIPATAANGDGEENGNGEAE